MAYKKKNAYEELNQQNNIPLPTSQVPIPVKVPESNSSSPVTPIPRVTLQNQDAVNALLTIQNPAPNAPVPAGTTGVTARRTGFNNWEMNLPDGSKFTGTKAEVDAMINKFHAINPQEDPRLTEMRDNAKIKAQYDAEVAANTPPNATPEQLAQVGKITDLTGQPNETTDSINQKIFMRKVVSGKANKELQQWTQENPGKLPPVPFLNRISGSIPGGNVKNTIIDLMSNTETGRAYWEDYSNENNYNSIKNDITLALASVNGGMRDVSTGSNTDLAEQSYNDAWSRLALAESQLKQISDNDQRAYTEKVRTDLKNLRYQLTEVKTRKDRIFSNMLKKPDPTYIQNYNNPSVNGDVQNGGD